jgi:hypothetical protein
MLFYRGLVIGGLISLAMWGLAFLAGRSMAAITIAAALLLWLRSSEESITVDGRERETLRDAADYIVALPEKTLRREQGDAPRNQPIVAWVQIGSKFALRSVTRSGKRLKFLDRKGGRVV